MRRIRGQDTKPELAVRRLFRRLGFCGYRLHRKELPGTPDIAFIGRRKAIFVHGCFWHGHLCKVGVRKPLSNTEYWLPKIERTRARDDAHLQRLTSLGWTVLTIWECELKNTEELVYRLSEFMRNHVDR